MQDMKVNLMYVVSEGILLNLNFMATFYGQRFPNSGNRWGWGWVNPHHWGGWRVSEILLGKFFYQVKGTWFWPSEPFSKLKTDFCEYWTSIKIKINMTWVSKEYEIKPKMEQEQWLLEDCWLVGRAAFPQ